MSGHFYRGFRIGVVPLLTLFGASLTDASASGLSTANPAVLNSPAYFRLVESNASHITVRFEVAPGKDIPNDARVILAVPEPRYELRILDYAYFDEARGRSHLIEQGDAEAPSGETARQKRWLKTDTLWWHDLALEVITLRTRFSVSEESSSQNRRLCRLEFSLDFTAQPSLEKADYAIGRPGGPAGGYAEILSRTVLNPESVPEFRRRPDIALPDDLFRPEALGRFSPSGRALRILVEREGWYEIAYPQLKTIGAGVPDWDPGRVNLWSEGEPVPLEIEGLSAEGDWMDESRLRFWGLPSPSPDSRERVYFLAEGTRPRHRLTPLPPPGEASEETLRCVTYELTQAPERFIEEDRHAYVQGKWLWLKLTQDQPEVSEAIPALGIDPHSATVSLTATLYSDTRETARIELLVDGQHPVGTFELARRTKSVKSFQVPSRWLLGEGHTLTWRAAEPLKHPDGGGVLLEKIVWRYQRLLRIGQPGQLTLQRKLWNQDKDLLLEATAPVVAFGRNASGTQLWDLRPRIESTPEGQVLRLAGASLPPECTHLALAEAGRDWKPADVQPVEPAFLHEATEPADVLFLSHRDFIDAVTPLAEWRRREGWKVRIVDVQAVYDEFSHGSYSAQAIRDFLTYTQVRWPAPIPQYVVLVGDSTYDPKNNLDTPVASYLPYASYNRRVPIADPADEWFVCVNGSDGLSDLIIGRISVSSVTDAQSVVEKILRFESRPLLGPWRCRTMLLSDHYFENQCERLLHQTIPPFFERKHLQVRNYPMFTHQSFKKRGKNKKMTASANRELIAQMNEGAGLLEYFGHGGGCVIADEGWHIGADRPNSDVLKLDNRRRLPFVSILSCLTGLINYPTKPFNYSLSEELVRRPKQGAIAAYGPSGFGGAHDHEVLTRALNLNLYQNPVHRLGDAATLTEGLYTLLKDNSIINRQFNFFGDPLTRNGVPSTEGQLECSPSTVNALQGGRLRLVGGTLAFSEGQGILRVYPSGSAQLLQSILVRLTGGRLEAELDWPPGAPTGEIRVQGYLWNAALGQDVLVSTSFQSQVPQVTLEPACPRWDRAAGAIVISATLENKTRLSCPDVGLLLAAGPREIERRTLALEPLGKRPIDFRLSPEWVKSGSWVELSLHTRPTAPLSFEPSHSPQAACLALLLDTPDEGSEKQLLAVDLSALPEHLYPGQGSTRLPLRVTCTKWEELSELEVSLQASLPSTERLALPDQAPSPGHWWSFHLPAVVTKDATEPLVLSLRRRWAHNAPKESTWSLDHPVRGHLDLALTHVEVADASPVGGYTIFLQAEVQNLGDPLSEPAQFTLSTNRKGSARNPLSNSFNVSAPSLPRSLRRGEIVRRLYRWEAFDNAGRFRLLGKVKGPGQSSDRNPANDRFEVPLQIVEYGNYIEQLKPLRFSEAGVIPAKIQQAYRRGLRELEWLVGYEYFNEHFAKPHLLQQLALFALGAEEFDLARRLVNKGMSLKPNDPANQYLQGSMLFLQHRLEEGTESLRAALQGGFFEGKSELAYRARSDPRLVRARRRARSRHWQGNEVLLYSILEQQPANLWALEALGDLYRYHRLLERAAETYQQVLRLVNYDYSVLPDWWFRRAGQTYAELGQPEKALDIFALGRKYHSQVDFALWEADPRVDLGQAQEVLDELLARVQETLGPEERVLAWYEIGRCYEAEQHWQAAEEAFRSSLQLDPLHRASRRRLLKLRTQER